MRKNISTNTPSEKRVGYSRAVRVNNTLYLSGTTSMDESGNTIGKTLYKQADYIFQKIKTVLKSEGFSKKDVISITAYLVAMEHLSDFDKAFAKHFYEVKPACTVVGVKELVKPDLLIEIASIAQKE